MRKFIEKEDLEQIKKVHGPGVYMFWHNIYPHNGKIIFYIGSSSKLNKRILSSLDERVINSGYDDNAISVSVIKTASELEARILELYLIGTLKPLWNKSDITHQPLSFKIDHPPFECIAFLRIEVTSDIPLISNK